MICSKKYKLNSDITSKKIKQINILGSLHMANSKYKTIYYLEFVFVDGTKSEYRMNENIYNQYLKLVG